MNHQSSQFITPDEESQQLMSQYLSDSLQQVNPDVIQQIRNDNLFKILSEELSGKPSNDQEFQKLNDQSKLIHELCNKKSTQKQKRKEELQKFAFKKAFKRIESNFYSKIKKTIRKNKVENKVKTSQIEFYETYFKELSKATGQPLQHFIHPQKKFQIGTCTYQSGYKSFSQQYINTIKRAKKFQQDAKDYLENNFIQECLDEMKAKLQKFILFCSQKYQETINLYYQNYAKSDDEEQFRNFTRQKMEELILKNSKCKVPWSYSDILEAQKFALSILESEMEIESE